MVPSEIRYVAEAASPYADVQLMMSHVAEQRLDAMSPEELGRLAALYEEIHRRGHAAAIGEWYYEKSAKGDPLRQSVSNLFHLFALLRSRSIAPFASGKVELRAREQPRDWSKLPEGLQYLAAPAEKYGVYEYHDELLAAARRVTPEERAGLIELARRFLRDYDAIDAWRDANSFTESVESWRVYNLERLLEYSGLFDAAEEAQ